MDGVGVGRQDESDAVHVARTPVLDGLVASFPNTVLKAHGTAVGLPGDDDMGNSEVGHNALGAGRVFDQGAKLVNKALEEGSAFGTKLWRDMVDRCFQGGTLHLIGLLSDGNVHSHIRHLFTILDRACQQEVHRARVHILLDGRDVPETSALEFVHPLEDKLAACRANGCDYLIASGGGRMVTTMDRYEADWQIVERGWKAHVHGQARRFPDAETAISTYRTEEPGLSDQFLPPFVIGRDDEPVGAMHDGDVVLFFNFRGDRAIEISRTFEEDDFEHFDRGVRPRVLYAGMMEYDGDLHIPSRYLVDPPAIERTVSEYLVHAGIDQLAVAETQKFGHVTYFWNGNRSGKFDAARESYIEVPSDRVPFEQRPWMKAAEVADEVIAGIRSRRFPFIRVNFANGDMVGHTGDRDATILAVEAVDLCLGRIWREVRRADGLMIVTADHGNADQMYQLGKNGTILRDASGNPLPLTSHSLNPVRFVVADTRQTLGYALMPPHDAGLANVAATILNLLGYNAPEDYQPSLVTPLGTTP
ncbi:2,3-bisphosphoglycerate-independent phosphoglycerate mutase [Candidatus Fermentibacteria bacterium]|nr:2,3-bisphosphoglycerate-independent phosphoglycerate mutase [Candidatus Fermentibacteria bacterium]